MLHLAEKTCYTERKSYCRGESEKFIISAWGKIYSYLYMLHGIYYAKEKELPIFI